MDRSGAASSVSRVLCAPARFYSYIYNEPFLKKNCVALELVNWSITIHVLTLTSKLYRALS